MEPLGTRTPGPGRVPLLVLLGMSVVLLAARHCGGAAVPVPGDSFVVPNETVAYVKGRLELSLTAAHPAGAAASSLALSGCFLPPEPAPSTAGVLQLLGSYAEGLCGVRVQPVAQGHSGTWALRAEFKDFPNYTTSATAEVTVKDFSDVILPDKPSLTEGGEGFALGMQLMDGGLTLSDCVVTPPGGSGVALAPAAPAGRLQYDSGEAGAGLAQGRCAVRVEGVQVRDHGQWILEATVAATGVVRRAATLVHVYELPVFVSPSSVTAELGETAVMKLVFASGRATATRWTGCQVLTPGGALLQLSGSGPRKDAQAVQSDGVVRLAGEEGAECGVQVGPLTGEQADAGGRKWTIVGELDGAERAAAARLFVKVPYKPTGVVSDPLPLGTRNLELRCGPAGAVSCELRDPGGALAASFAGPCVHKLERTRTSHNGTWTCSALLPGYSEPVEDTFVLSLVEPVRVLTAVTARAEDGGVVLQCRLAGARACPSALAYCRLDSPTGERHLLKEGVRVPAERRVWYAGAGLGRCDCSAAIRGPLLPSDLGVWRCLLGAPGSPVPRGALITLTGAAAGTRGARAAADADAGLVAVRNPPDGVVAPGGAATVGCRAPRPLSYCWLRTPRGELLAVSASGGGGGLPYHGLGLEVGECGVRIPSAVPANHSGTWRCGVGTEGNGGVNFDQEVPVDIVVSATQFVPLAANVSSGPGHAATLGCRSILSDALQYCRFRRPDGVSVHLADAGVSTAGQAGSGSGSGSRYRFLDGDGRGLAEGFCRLAISSVAEEDYGQWTCAARFAGDAVGRERTASVMLESDGLASAGLVGGVAAAAVLLLAAASFVGYRRCRPRLGLRRSPSMSPSETSDTPISPGSPLASVVGSRNTRASARLAAAALPSTRLPARLRGAGAGAGARAAGETIALEALPRPRPRNSPAAAAPEDSSGSEDHVDAFPASNRKRQ
ncbi:Fasciclin-3 [Frankliniella fusca]|uniref:Fasciclin-3 n=1 Tax=Frankliniella fusca TaxID=407009 RepID=A0AAE1H1R6_9NEOP|nr:Fasciclin-3 [Frankliniella fusca]